MKRRKLLHKIFFAFTVLFLGAPALVKFFESRTVTFESRESKSASGGPVLNQIRFNSAWQKQFWQMRQFHESSQMLRATESKGESQTVDFSKADFVEISVNKDALSGLHEAEFRQFESGEFEAAKPEREYSVSCGICHANGPRLIRPQWNSSRAPLSAADLITILLWNLRIKLSGPVQSAETMLTDLRNKKRLERKIPLHLKGVFWQQPLNVEGCNVCHGKRSLAEEAFLSVPDFLRRNELRMENLSTARHLFTEGSMPPPFHALSETDQTVLGRLFLLF